MVQIRFRKILIKRKSPYKEKENIRYYKGCWEYVEGEEHLEYN